MQAKLNLDLLTAFIDQIDGSQEVKNRWNILQQTDLSGFGLDYYRGKSDARIWSKKLHTCHTSQTLQTLLLQWT